MSKRIPQESEPFVPMPELSRPVAFARDVSRQRVLDARATLAERVSHNFHGIPDIHRALFANDRNYQGKEMLVVGHLSGRSKIAKDAYERGARLSLADIEKVANPMKRGRIVNEELQSGQKYDQVLFYMALAFYKGKALDGIVGKALDATDFENGGAFHTVSFDFEPMERYAAEHPNSPTATLSQIMRTFSKAGGMDRYQGQTIASVISKNVKGKEFAVSDTVNQRPETNEAWEEIRDLCVMLYSQAGEAMASMPDVASPKAAMREVRSQLRSFIIDVDRILDLPLNERPRGMPPALHTVTVTKN